MPYAFDGYCYATEAALADALNAHPARLGSDYNIVRRYVAWLPETDGDILAYQHVYNPSTGAYYGAGWSFYIGFSECADVGPLIPSESVAVEDVALYAAALLPMFVIAYCIRTFRGFLHGHR